MLKLLAEIVDGAIADVIRARDDVPAESDGYRQANQALRDLLELRGGIAFKIAIGGGK